MSANVAPHHADGKGGAASLDTPKRRCLFSP
jgi:hypothetical protein